jgi:hypothetical protein
MSSVEKAIKKLSRDLEKFKVSETKVKKDRPASIDMCVCRIDLEKFTCVELKEWLVEQNTKKISGLNKDELVNLVRKKIKKMKKVSEVAQILDVPSQEVSEVSDQTFSDSSDGNLSETSTVSTVSTFSTVSQMETIIQEKKIKFGIFTILTQLIFNNYTV